ncbi:hypothetical protein PCANC_03423 [Puccinia coronata f. sp. avenae]|uniref:Uncharacterized protein n=1 Tax=Puccinia coronata f. sp. avenae TaxID=200324 RepID=A0A2N5W2B9_9BASI|nr:hypothetical protein PCANC_03423 [Puccinia coronata f. sp. avenae]
MPIGSARLSGTPARHVHAYCIWGGVRTPFGHAAIKPPLPRIPVDYPVWEVFLHNPPTGFKGRYPALWIALQKKPLAAGLSGLVRPDSASLSGGDQSAARLSGGIRKADADFNLGTRPRWKNYPIKLGPMDQRSDKTKPPLPKGTPM